MIRIRSKTEGFRRCGVAFSAAWKNYEDGAFTPEELEILEGEPMLQVQTGEEAEDSGGSSGLTCKKLTAILARMGVDVPKPPVKKADLEALLDQALNTPAPAAPAAASGDPAKGGEA